MCADMLYALHHRDDPDCHLTDAKVMTSALVAALFFGGKYVAASAFFAEYGDMPRMVRSSRFNRRLHWVKDLFLPLFAFLGEHWKAVNTGSVSIIARFPIVQQSFSSFG